MELSYASTSVPLRVVIPANVASDVYKNLLERLFHGRVAVSGSPSKGIITREAVKLLDSTVVDAQQTMTECMCKCKLIHTHYTLLSFGRHGLLEWYVDGLSERHRAAWRRLNQSVSLRERIGEFWMRDPFLTILADHDLTDREMINSFFLVRAVASIQDASLELHGKDVFSRRSGRTVGVCVEGIISVQLGTLAFDGGFDTEQRVPHGLGILSTTTNRGHETKYKGYFLRGGLMNGAGTMTVDNNPCAVVFQDSVPYYMHDLNWLYPTFVDAVEHVELMMSTQHGLTIPVYITPPSIEAFVERIACGEPAQMFIRHYARIRIKKDVLTSSEWISFWMSMISFCVSSDELDRVNFFGSSTEKKR